LKEMRRLYLDDDGKPWFVSDSPYPPQAQRGGWRGFLTRWGA